MLFCTTSTAGRSLRSRVIPSSVNPASGDVIAEVSFGNEEDVDRAVVAAWRAYSDGRWRNLLPSERASRLRRVGALIRDQAENLAQVESQNNGKPLSAARMDVADAASALDYASTICENIRGTVYADQSGYHTYSTRVPYGVVGAIAPWNYPLVLAVCKTAFPLAAGNSVVLKMAEQTPLTSSMYARICAEAGIPAGVLNVVHGDGETTGAALVRHPRVPKITFTGSTDVGRAILRAAAQDIKSVHLELGGKSPNIVFADADMEQATAGALFTSFFNSGQICSAGTRLLVDERVEDEFLDGFVNRAKRLRIGDPLNPDTQLGPLVSAAQLDRVRRYIEDGVQSSATVVLGEADFQVDQTRGYYVAPTVFRGVDVGMRIAQEEIFGPVLSTLTFRSEEEAIALANSVTYGLAATVWTSRLDRAMRVADELEAGIIWTNCPHHLGWNTPYEGDKYSGLGEDCGMESVSSFTKLKVNYVNFGGDRMSWA